MASENSQLLESSIMEEVVVISRCNKVTGVLNVKLLTTE